MSLLSIIDQVDTFPYEKPSSYWSLLTPCGHSLGYITPEVAGRLQNSPNAQYFSFDSRAQTVALSEKLESFDKRNKVFGELALEWKRTDKAVASGWRDELYVVYFPRSKPYMLLERAFACILGVVTYGVHINGYVPAHKAKNGELKMWVPRRSATKQTYPGKLDNTIAGGLGYPLGIWENVVKECYEEGGLSEDFVKERVRAAGVVSYIHQPYGPGGHAQPEVEYIYDLEFEEGDEVPHPVDGEAEDFSLMPLAEVKERMLNGEFKPNCALVIVDFLVRHGYVTPDNEPNYLEVVCRLHRRFPFSTMN